MVNECTAITSRLFFLQLFFAFFRTNCKPMHFEWETVHRQYSAPSSYIYVNIFDFFKQTSSRTEMIMLHGTPVSQTINVRHKTK